MAFSLSGFAAMREALRSCNFAIFTLGNGVSVLGTWIQRLSVGWLTWHLTGSGTWLGAVAFAEFAPVIVLAPFMGVITDRFDRRRIAILGQCLAAVQAITLAALTLSGVVTPILVLSLQLFGGIVQPLIQTARLVLVPTLVPRERVGNAVAITSLVFQLARIVGPMIAGVLITAVGVGWSFAANAASYLPVIYALALLELPPHRAPRRAVSARGLRSDVVAGWRYVAAHPLLGWVVPTVGIASLLTWPIGDLLPGVADHMFGRGAAALATFTSAQGIGAILGGLFLAQRPSAEGLARIVTGAMIANGAMIALFAVTPLYWLAVPILLISSFFGVMVGVGSQSLAQIAVTEDMRGRTLSVWYTVTRAGPALGAVMLGTLATRFGFGKPLFFAGAVTALTGAAAWWRKHRPTA
jgi:MFS family permease